MPRAGTSRCSALSILTRLKAEGRLARADEWMVSALQERLLDSDLTGS
jgi:hypothetical protein